MLNTRRRHTAASLFFLLLFGVGAGCLLDDSEQNSKPQIVDGAVDFDDDGRIDFVLGPFFIRSPGGEQPPYSGPPHLKGYQALGTGANSFVGEQRVRISGVDTVVTSGPVAPLETGVLIGPELGDSLSWKSRSHIEPEEFWAPEGKYLAFRLAESDMSANRIHESTIRYGWMRISIDTSASVDLDHEAYPVLLHEYEIGRPGVSLKTGEKL